jgi:3,4-dihydroxy 2-butanone 4-phosphate synthase/GTP cyclohydrolase II
LTHQVRAVHDAILVGINTVLRDDPRLNVRLVEGQSPQPIVVDSRLRFPMDANLLRDPCIRPIIFTHPDSCEKKEEQLRDRGATVLRVGGRRDGWIELAELLAYLKSLGLRSVMVEGGASIITSVLRSRLANQVLLTISARFLGGLPSMHRMHGDDAYHPPQLDNLKYQWLGNDLILCGDLLPLDTTPLREVAICDRAASPSTLLSKSTSGEGGTL